jgi:hypothetical protein
VVCIPCFDLLESEVGNIDGGVEIEDDGSRLFLDFETDEEVQVSIGDT